MEAGSLLEESDMKDVGAADGSRMWVDMKFWYNCLVLRVFYRRDDRGEE